MLLHLYFTSSYQIPLAPVFFNPTVRKEYYFLRITAWEVSLVLLFLNLNLFILTQHGNMMSFNTWKHILESLQMTKFVYKRVAKIDCMSTVKKTTCWLNKRKYFWLADWLANVSDIWLRVLHCMLGNSWFFTLLIGLSIIHSVDQGLD